jgi:hypothetical protein
MDKGHTGAAYRTACGTPGHVTDTKGSFISEHITDMFDMNVSLLSPQSLLVYRQELPMSSWADSS